MKKLFLLLSSILILLVLTSCEHFVPGGGQVERPPLMSAEGSEDSSSSPAGEEDPTVDEYGFTLFPEGNYLADPMFDTDEFLPDYDMDVSFIQAASTWRVGLFATADGFYSKLGPFVDGIDAELLMYTDTAMGLTMPLCGKPECTHDNYTCNAWVGRNASGLRIYDGKIYWVDEPEDTTLVLKRMNLDGTEHETVTTMDREWRTSFNLCATFFLHRGYVYIAGAKQKIVEGEQKTAYYVYAKPIDGGEGFTVMSKLMDGAGSCCGIRPVGNELYITVSTSDYEDWENRTGEINYLDFYRWDSKSRKVECLYTQDGDTENGIRCYYDPIIPLPVEDGLYINYQETEEGKSVSHILKYTYATGRFEETGSIVLPGNAVRYTSEYVVLFCSPYLYLYDYNGNLVYRSQEIERNPGSMLMGTDERYAYYQCMGYFDSGDPCFLAIPLNGGEVMEFGGVS